MNAWQRLTREPNLILGVVVAGLSLAVLFGVDLTADQLAGIGVFVGAVVALVRFVTTPAGEVVAQRKPGDEVATAGQASVLTTGTPVDVELVPAGEQPAP